MFIEMNRQRFDLPFGKARMWLRYDIRALYNIENSGFAPFDIISQCTDPKAVRCFLKNGLADWYSEIGDEENDIDVYVNKLMGAGGFQTELTAYIQAAVIQSLPQASVGKRKNIPAEGNILGLMTAIVDIMKIPEEKFLSMTMREASERWERYAVAMGYQKPVEKFSRYDDDDDDDRGDTQ